MKLPRTPERVKGAARQAVWRAVREGRLVRQPCEVCGDANSEAHHTDYANPLDVSWLCRLHHRWITAYGDTVDSMKRTSA